MTPQHRHLLKTTFLISLSFFSCLIWAEVNQEPAIHAPVNELHTSLLSIMENADTKTFQERYDVMEEVVVKHFNSPLISKVILSRHWKTLEEQSQSEFIDLFNRLTISTYVNRFDSFNGESFKNLSIEQMKENRFMVKTEFVRTNDVPVSFNYIVQNDDGEWKIISVIANGINDLSLKRADYSAIIKEKGFDALIASLKVKISDLQPK
ncbi:MAG: phospholipid transport system substrate-binding protein [Gammaproteobacteria bacterium]|jgi:phospholipid transport system substrate-binding protein